MCVRGEERKKKGTNTEKGMVIESMCVCMWGCVKVCVCVLIKTDREGEGEKEACERESSMPVSKDLAMRK